MALFNFIETFFFISLGITFALILLLVYHFKQRMTGLEQKCDTMFEIINDMVKEMNLIRTQTVRQMPMQMPSFFQTMNNNNTQINEPTEFIVVSDNDESDSDEGSDDEDSQDQEDIKIINVNKETLDELDIEDIISIQDDEVTDGHESDDHDENDDENDDDENTDNSNSEPILVEKIETIEIFEPQVENASKESDKDIYKKMSLPALKTLVISKGLCSDPSKMKKNDLLKLLESTDE
jgi:hypothetical protein